MEGHDLETIQIKPIGFVRRTASHQDTRDKSLVSQVVLRTELAPALDGIEEWSHVYVLYWFNEVVSLLSHHLTSWHEPPSLWSPATRRAGVLYSNFSI